jgi:hypothetical protein
LLSNVAYTSGNAAPVLTGSGVWKRRLLRVELLRDAVAPLSVGLLRRFDFLAALAA